MAPKRNTFFFFLSTVKIEEVIFLKEKEENLKQWYTSEAVLSLSEENERLDDVETGVFALTQMEEKHPQQYHHVVQGSRCGRTERQRECIPEGVHVSRVNSLSALGEEKEGY